LGLEASKVSTSWRRVGSKLQASSRNAERSLGASSIAFLQHLANLQLALRSHAPVLFISALLIS